VETFIARAKIAKFEAMLLAEDNFVRQEMLHELIVAEEAKLIAMEKRRTAESGRRRWPAGYFYEARAATIHSPTEASTSSTQAMTNEANKRPTS
jgi:hypothetical protein